MKRTLLFMVLTISLSLCIKVEKVYSQKTNFTPPDYSIHSPNVTSLGKYGDYPVNFSTGVPSIEVPLYTIKAGKLELPISLSYHASGIKVDQESSFVGLGWVLNAGGLVTRILKDKKDEGSSGFINTGGTLPDYNPIDHVNGAAGKIGNNPTLLGLTYIDKEPDLFNIMANGLNNEFCLNNSGKFVSIGLDSLQYNIDLINNLMIIKDRNGNIFRFGRSLDNKEAFEKTSLISYSDGISSSYEDHNSSWHLTEMISSDYTDTISFKYITQFYYERKPINVTRYVLNADITSPITEGFEGMMTNELTTSIPNVQLLSKIIFKNGSLEFSTVEDRIDISSPGVTAPSKARITGFKVYDTYRNVIKSVLFENGDYFNRTASAAPILGFSSSSERTKSLKLNSVKFLDKNDISNSEYRFEYDETPLPPRNTTAQDFWGYYNGSTNSSLIPKTFYLNPRGMPSYYGENRKTNYNYMKAGILKKVIFPTGGYTVYDYEPNYYLNENQIQNQVKQTQTIILAAINRLESCRPNYFPGIPANNSLEFTPTENIVGNSGKLLVVFSDFHVSNGQSMTFKLTGNGTEICSFERNPSSDHQVLTFSKDISIRAGEVYKLEAKTNGVTGSNVSLCNSPFVQASLYYDYWVTVTENQITPEQAGGLRVKNITNFNSENTVIAKKTYEYGRKGYGSNNVGAGELLTDPSKNFFNYPLLYWQNSNATLKNVLWFSSDSQVELGSNRGCPVYYSKVSEKILSYDNITLNGKTEYYYENMDRYYEPKSSSKYPYNFPLYPSWGNQLVKTVLYGQSVDGSFLQKKSIQYRYNNLQQKRIKTLKIVDFEPDIYAGSAGTSTFYLMDNPRRFFYYNFYVPRGKPVKSKEIIKEYNGSDSLVTEKTFLYNKYFDLSNEYYINSKSDTIENKYKYTADLDYTLLNNNFIVSLPIQNEEVVNGKVKQGSILKYDDLGRLSEHFTAVTSNVSIPYGSFNNIPNNYQKTNSYTYDALTGNIRSIKTEKSISTIYIWSYNGEYPVMEIKNADYALVESLLGGAAGVLNFGKSSPTDTQISALSTTLRNSMPDAKVTTYTYKPLVGMASSTDPKGQTTYYEYDGFQRLKSIKDQNGNIVKSYDYHYKP